MKTLIIESEISLPGTGIILEKGDKVKIKEVGNSKEYMASLSFSMRTVKKFNNNYGKAFVALCDFIRNEQPDLLEKWESSL
jgi:hypothetical protein